MSGPRPSRLDVRGHRLRAAAGGAAGWAAIRWGVTEPEPSWAPGSAAAVAAAGGLAAPAVARGAGATVVTGWAAASVLGLYLGVPETDHVVGVAAVLAVLVLTSLAAPRPASWVLVAGLDVVLVWAAVRGAPGGGPALVAGLAMPGLLVVAPLTSHVPGPRRALGAGVGPAGGARRRCRQRFAVVVARNAASRDTIAEATHAGRRRARRARRWRRASPSGPVVVKRAIDLVVAATLLVLTAPLLAAIAVAVRIVDGPPVLFRQARSGRGGRPFELVKFRTMRPAAPRRGRPAARRRAPHPARPVPALDRASTSCRRSSTSCAARWPRRAATAAGELPPPLRRRRRPAGWRSGRGSPAGPR